LPHELGSAIHRADFTAKGKKLITLRDAALYVTKLPGAEHDAEEWQAATQALLLVVAHMDRPCSPGSASCGHKTVTSNACSTRIGKTSIGSAGSWCGIDDNEPSRLAWCQL
jgi:hypothetical protein